MAEHGLSLAAMVKLLIAVMPLVAEHGLQGTGSVAVPPGLSRSLACGIFPDQGSNPCLLCWYVDSLPLSHQEQKQFY